MMRTMLVKHNYFLNILQKIEVSFNAISVLTVNFKFTAPFKTICTNTLKSNTQEYTPLI